MNKAILMSVVLVPLVFAGRMATTEAPDNTSVQDYVHFTVEDPTFQGVDRCKTCHKKEDQGEQYRLWQEGPHAKAYETLATDKAKEIGAAQGIDDPQTADACLSCHVTGHGEPAERFGTKYKIEDGVGCESCHGAGGDYYKKKTMQGITDGEIDGASVGLIEANEETCRTCHNEDSPTFEGFDYEERVKEIAHPIPEGGGE